MEDIIFNLFRIGLAYIPIGFMLMFSEYFYRAKLVRGEIARKSVHILAGGWISMWGWILPPNTLILATSMLTLGVMIALKVGIFKGIGDIERKSFGELFFGLGILSAAILFKDPLVFAAAVLHMSVADGFAAIFGSAFGKKRYSVLGVRKSYLGSFTFFVMSLLIFIGGVFWTTAELQGLVAAGCIGFAFTLALIEAVAPRGADNIVLPIIAGVFFQILAR